MKPTDCKKRVGGAVNYRLVACGIVLMRYGAEGVGAGTDEQQAQ